METPKLIENGVKNYLHYSLNKCHETRVRMHTIALNVGVFLFFIGIFGTSLYFCYKKKPLQIDKDRQMLKDQEMILSKIRYYQQTKQHQKDTLTNLSKLPVTDNLTSSLREFY